MEVDRPITIAVILFLILIMAFYLVLPKYQAFQSVLLELGKKEAEYEGKSAYFIEVTRTYKELMQYEENLKKIESALPEKFSLATLVNLLYKKSAENGIVIQRISASKPATVGTGMDVKETTISLDVIGAYEPLKKFVASLEKSARLIEGENIAFSVSMPTVKNPKPQQSYPIGLEIKVYSYQK